MTGPHSPLTCMLWSEFRENPSLMYGLFWSDLGVGHLAYHPSRVTVLSTDLTDDQDLTVDQSRHNRLFQVETLEELQAVKHQLKTKPFLLKMSACFNHTDHYVVVKLTTNYTETYAVLVNSAHSMISTVLDAKFEQAAECLLRGKRFCIELDFNRALARFHADMLHNQTRGGAMRVRERAHAEYGRVYITNHTPYNHCFEPSPWCCVCLPIMCFIAPCYLIHRAASCRDLPYMFEDVPAILRTGLEPGQVAEIAQDHRQSANSAEVHLQMTMTATTPQQHSGHRQEEPVVADIHRAPSSIQRPETQAQQPAAILQQPQYLPPPYTELQQQQQQQQIPSGDQPPAYTP